QRGFHTLASVVWNLYFPESATRQFFPCSVVVSHRAVTAVTRVRFPAREGPFFHLFRRSASSLIVFFSASSDDPRLGGNDYCSPSESHRQTRQFSQVSEGYCLAAQAVSVADCPFAIFPVRADEAP